MEEHIDMRRAKLALVGEDLHTASDFAWAFLRRNPEYAKEAAQNINRSKATEHGLTTYSSEPNDQKARPWGLEFFRRSRRESGGRFLLLAQPC